MGRKISTTVYLDESQNEELDKINKYTRIPKAVIIREGVDLILKQYASMGEIEEEDIFENEELDIDNYYIK